jgi:hypothetical protein
MPKLSRETASEVREFGRVIGRREEMDAYTAELVSFGADPDLGGPLQALPGDACRCPPRGEMIAGRMRFVFADHEEVCEIGDARSTGRRVSTRCGRRHGLPRFNPTTERPEIERAMAEWMRKRGAS